MGYSYSDTTPAPDSPFAGLPAPKEERMTQILNLVTAIHGEVIAGALLRYTTNMGNAMKLSVEIERHAAEAGADQTTQPGGRTDWSSMAEEIRSAVTSYQAAAEAMDDLTGTKACTTSLLALVPSALLGRIISNGIASEADALLDLLDAVCPPSPAPEPEPDSGPGDDYEEPNVLCPGG